MYGEFLYWKYEGILFLGRRLVPNIANIQSVNAFVGEFDIQKRVVPCLDRFTNPESFE